eukprot:scaffold123582_cov63-Phaeocystis_antarctica.AAC.4
MDAAEGGAVAPQPADDTLRLGAHRRQVVEERGGERRVEPGLRLRVLAEAVKGSVERGESEHTVGAAAIEPRIVLGSTALRRHVHCAHVGPSCHLVEVGARGEQARLPDAEQREAARCEAELDEFVHLEHLGQQRLERRQREDAREAHGRRRAAVPHEVRQHQRAAQAARHRRGVAQRDEPLAQPTRRLVDEILARTVARLRPCRLRPVAVWGRARAVSVVPELL